jgi:hypothetical protein
MDLFKFTDITNFQGGQPIIGYDSAAWVERYRQPGDFQIIAKLSSGLRELLPDGSLISHVKTLEIMMVENVQISEELDADPIVTITGRSLQAILEQRIVGQNRNWASPPASLEVSQYTLSAADTWDQAVILINDHIKVGTVVTSGDGIANLVAIDGVSGITGTSEARTIGRGDVLAALQQLLEIDDLGLRVIRDHEFSTSIAVATNSFFIHNGHDKRNSIIFSTKNGDIDAADYLWSIKSLKTAALVTGKFIEAMVAGSATGFNKRVMHVDAQDIDGNLEAIPTGGTLTTLRAAMVVRGNAALKAQKRLALSRVDISKTPTYDYRLDYDIGDLVSVDTNYGPLSSMRVVEHIEVVDETGESSMPTLEFYEP